MRRQGIARNALPVLALTIALGACAPGTKTSPASPEAGAPASDKAVYITEKYPGGEYQRLSFDVSGIARPKSLEEFAVLPHLSPVQQHKSDMCWCFGTVSLLESEIARLGRPASSSPRRTRSTGSSSRRPGASSSARAIPSSGAAPSPPRPSPG